MPRRSWPLLLAVVFAHPVLAADPDPFDQSGVPVEELPTDPKAVKVVLIAGLPAPKLKSGEHEYFAGCALLAKMLKQTPGVHPVVVKDGWPKKKETLAGAKAVVLFIEGGDASTVIQADRMTDLLALEAAGAGIVHPHSAIDYPKDFGERVRTCAGGAWEKGVGQRAHWVSEFKEFPVHPVCHGVTPFTLDDGWLWNIRFADKMTGVTPLLRTKSPKDNGKTSDDEAIVGWAYDRPTGGRSFTFTGCHLHESWKQDGYRRFLVNGILWSAGLEIPKSGAAVELAAADERVHLDRKPVGK